MDRFSHIAFAEGLLRIADERVELAYLSTLPMIDSEPSFLHRLQCHPLVKAPVLADCARVVFGSTDGNRPAVDEESYELTRLRSESAEFEHMFEKVNGTGNGGASSMAVDSGLGAVLAIASHTYFDTYNNPVQAFPPYEAYCAARYDMWRELDYFDFRVVWYQQTAPKFRELVLAEPFWNVRIPTAELVRAMVRRLAAMTLPAVAEETILAVEERLGVGGAERNDRADEFFIQLEESLDRHLVASVREAEAARAVVGVS